MKAFISIFTVCLYLILPTEKVEAQKLSNPEKPWVFWYWMQASISKPGITADLEAMKEAGIGGAYLMPIKGPTEPPLMEPVITQLTPEWWDMVLFAMDEAKRVGVHLGMHASDGFALAGGPWITPELSMQKITWSETSVQGNQEIQEINLPQPQSNESYYEDIAVYAVPVPFQPASSSQLKPTVTTSTNAPADFLPLGQKNEVFRCDEDCWFQYSFEQPFTCRSIRVVTRGNNYQSHRLLVETSDNGEDWERIYQMEPPRHGWQDTDAAVTYAIPATTARYFRFQWSKEGTEPGAEDLDAAKWSPRLKLAGLEMSNLPRIHQFEGKAGLVWRISPRTRTNQLQDQDCIPLGSLIDLTERMEPNGKLTWKAPEGNWLILRIGHTSTGHTNATGGGGKGLECDKFNPEAINLQFDSWFGEILEQAGSRADVLKMFHIDSWECGSQNWSPVFRKEFQERQGYDLVSYLPIMTGLPLESVDFSEKVLYDVRETISDLLIDNFFGIMARRAKENDLLFSAESVAPTMLSDGMRHYAKTDFPMGEFWLRSPTHDKPNDMLDAISAAHVYEKQIVQAEGFTELRMAWDEHPAMLKTLGDRNYALGINRLFYHVFMHNPWMNRQPGMTLDGVGLYLQRDQTWWDHGKAWVTYAERCQALLQQGKPVTDIAVFTGEDFPRRAILPDRLVSTLPGIFGEAVVSSEKERLKNTNQPQREMPAGVRHSANMADPEDWTDPLNGYKYDSFNKDALLRLASIEQGKLTLPGGASYQLLVLPQKRKMAPNPEYMSPEVTDKLLKMVEAGMTLLVSEKPEETPGLTSEKHSMEKIQTLWAGDFKKIENPSGTYRMKTVGKGKVIKTPFEASSFEVLGVEPDLLALSEKGKKAHQIAWTHRRADNRDIYFISNQLEKERILNLSLRITGKLPELYDPVTDVQMTANEWTIEKERTILPVKLPANGSLFVILEKDTKRKSSSSSKNWPEFKSVKTLAEPWKVTFESALGGPEVPLTLDQLTSWIHHPDDRVKYYSGTAVYETTFNAKKTENLWIDLGKVANTARLLVNGEACGTAWTAPYRINISEAVKPGENELRVEVSNTWRNRMIRDHNLPEKEQITKTTAPYRLEGKPLLEAGLLGPVKILRQAKEQ